MNKLEKLQEATIMALQGKLTESKESEQDIIKDIEGIINIFDRDNHDYRFKGWDAKIDNNVLKMYYQTEEDIEKDDVKYICDNIIPYIKKSLKDNENTVTSIEITFYDRSGRYEDGSLKKSYKITPFKSNSSKSSKLSKELVSQVADLIINVYDGITDAVGGAEGSIYEVLAELFEPDNEYYGEDIIEYCNNHNLNISNIDFTNKQLIKPIALELIKRICAQEGWSVSIAKEDCEY